MEHRKKTYIKLTIVIVCVAILFVYLSASLFQAKPSIKYLTVATSTGNITLQAIATGEVNPSQLVSVGSQASGQIKKIHIEVGQTVAQGDLLAEIDSTTQVNELKTARATLETYKAQLASKEIALRVAQQQYARESKLKSQDATSRENFENAENTLAKAKADVTEAGSLIMQAQITVDNAEANLGYTQITAPIDGTIVYLPVEEGQTINASQVTPVLVQVADLSRMKIKMQISEADVTKVSVGMPVTFTILSAPETEYKTILQSIDPASTALAATTVTESATYYYGRLIVDNPEGKLRIGMTTQNIIKIASAKNVLTVPNISIQEQNGEKYVLVLPNSGEPVKKVITTGLSDNMNTEVKSGLEPGEKVVTAQMTEDEINASVGKMR